MGIVLSIVGGFETDLANSMLTYYLLFVNFRKTFTISGPSDLTGPVPRLDILFQRVHKIYSIGLRFRHEAITMGFIGHKSFSAENARDPASQLLEQHVPAFDFARKQNYLLALSPLKKQKAPEGANVLTSGDGRNRTAVQQGI